LLVYWYVVSGNRDEFAELVKVSAPNGVVCVVVREALFENANSVFSDLVQLLEKNRALFEGLKISSSDKVAVVLLARRRLMVPQTASPAQMPHWFPGVGGETIESYIEDITNTAAGYLNNSEIDISEVCVDLFGLEEVLLRRLLICNQRDHKAGNGFYSVLGERLGGIKYGAFLETALERSTQIQNPTGFRPSARAKYSLVGQLMSIITATSPDGLQKVSRHFAKALHLEAVPAEGSSGADFTITSVLLRSTNPETDQAIMLAKNILVSIYIASQFVTAAAHADSYPKFPIITLRTICVDIRRSLQSMARLLTTD
jgi:hypothetical protein